MWKSDEIVCLAAPLGQIKEIEDLSGGSKNSKSTVWVLERKIYYRDNLNLVMPREKIIPIVIIGASGFGKEVAMTIEDCIKNGKNYELLGFIDDDKSLHKKNIYNYPVLGGVNWLENKKNKIVQ